jgi:glycosyltransferase involved in cell wall biosynthesis
MRILIYTTAFAPSVGGVETYVMLLAKGLADISTPSAPMEITVATRSAANGYDDSCLGFRVVRQPSLETLLRLIRQADLIHVAGPCLAPMAIAWLLRKPVVVEHHGYQAACPNGLLLREPMKKVCPEYFMQRSYGKCLRCEKSEHGWAGATWKVISTFIRRWLSNRASANVAVSEHVARRLAMARSQVIYHGIAPAPILSQGRIETPQPGPLTIGFIGRLVAEKGLGTLIDAASDLVAEGFDFRLRFIGDGPEKASLEESISSHGLRARTEFTGHVTGEAFLAATKEVSIVVIPTISEETFGLAALEQMARGRLVVASDIGGLAEVVDDGGLKFKAGDSAALAQVLRNLLQNTSIINDYSTKARRRAGYFGLDRMIAEHVALYRRILDQKNSAGSASA